MKRTLPLLLILVSVVVRGQSVLTTVDSLMLNADYHGAIGIVEKALLRTPESMLLQAKKADALIRLGRLDEAETILNAASANAIPNEQGIVLYTKGYFFINQGRYDLAIETLHEALSKFENTGQLQTLDGAQALAYLGQAYKYTGKVNQALEQLQRALSIRKSILPEDHELIAASYNDLGLAYAGIDNNKALDFYELALKIYQQLHGTEHAKIAIANINTGFIYKSLELYGDAVNNFETSLAIWNKIYSGPHQTKAFALLNLGDTYQRMGNNSAARGYYEKSLAIYEESYGERHPDLADVLNKLGNLELLFEKYDKAINYYQRAIIANTVAFSNSDPKKNPGMNEYYNGTVLLYSLLYKAQAFEARYFGKSLKFADLTTALYTLTSCDSLVDNLRQQSTNENDKISLGTLANEVYADGVRIASEAAHNSIHRKDYLKIAFYFAEKSKSAVLLEAISDTEAKSFAGIPEQTLEEEKMIKADIAQIAQKLSQKPNAEEEHSLRDSLFLLNRKFTQFTKRLEQQFPEYYNLKFNTQNPSIEDLQNLLDENTAVISYFIDDKNQRLYTFTITSNNFNLEDTGLPKDFDKQIKGLRNGLLFNEINVFARSSSILSSLLIPKIKSAVSEIIFLPTGRMSVVPFETLPTKTPRTDESFETYPYLLKKYSVKYEFSASLLLQKQRNDSPVSPPAIMLCAPVTFSANENLPELPGTASEVSEISQLFASKNYLATASIGEDANETFIKNTSFEQFNMLHFATHGVVDENHPELSRIFLQRGSDDGNLFASEIYNMKLKADLVTLSACQTGLGKISKGEGVIGLSRALVYAGAKNIIVSFWSVADESTAVLMKNFYHRLLESPKPDYAGSLRSAKLSLIGNKQYASPYYWAPFILIGY